MSTQPKFNSKGKMIEELDVRAPFMSPKPVSPKRKVSDNSGNQNLVSILGKRKFNEAFDATTFDDDRYGQHINTDFFNTNVGHNVVQVAEKKHYFEQKEEEYIKSFTREEEQEILNWCEFYRANRNLYNV